MVYLFSVFDWGRGVLHEPQPDPEVHGELGDHQGAPGLRGQALPGTKGRI